MNIGDIVHYVSYGTPGGEFESKCRAAVITAIPKWDDGPMPLDLCVLNPTGIFLNIGVFFQNKGEGGSWHERSDCDN